MHQANDGIHQSRATLRAALCLAAGLAVPLMAIAAPKEVVLYNFSGSDGSSPNTLLLAANGKYYGTTSVGGANNLGTVFELTPAGVLKTLHTFVGPDGSAPSALIAGAAGVFYGATTMGGSSNLGVLFSMTPTGSFTLLHSFQGADGSAPNSLTIAGNGKIYGTTSAGGASDDGTIFVLDKGTELRVLHEFSGADGAQPGGPLIQASDNQLYGVTSGGGGDGFGTVFKISPGGALTTLVADGLPIGGEPVGALVQGENGNFYGVTTASYGAIYEMTPSGTTDQLYVFGSAPGDGAGFQAGLTLSSNGDLYGTNTFGGEFAYGGLFRMTAAGKVTHLRAFEPSTDGTLFSSLVLGPMGRLYASGQVGGTNGDGVVESFSPEPIPPTLGFSANPTMLSLSQGNTTSLVWSVTDADTCLASGAWSGEQPTTAYNSTTISYAAPGTYVYSLDCTGGGGSITESVTVTVTN
jgi:uncharacterized repeat protein (TIGR03803 family)